MTYDGSSRIGGGKSPFRAVSAALLGLALSAQAHQTLQRNMDLTLQLKPDAFLLYLTVATFQFPPLAAVESFAQQVPLDVCRPAVEAFLGEHCPVRIDGMPVTPILEAVRFHDVPRGIHLGGERAFVVADLKVRYPAKTEPRRVALQWGLFVEPPPGGWDGMVDADQIPEEIVAPVHRGKRVEFAFLSPQEPEYIWHAASEAPTGVSTRVEAESPVTLPTLPIAVAMGLPVFLLLARRRGVPWALTAPIAAVALAGAVAARDVWRVDVARLPGRTVRLPDDVAAEALVRSLLSNVYRAFDYGDEGQVYDVLARSVDGALLETVYVQTRESLILREEGGAVCRVQRVEPLTVRVRERARGSRNDAPHLAVEALWRVHGLVEHWNHMHRRVNEYAADLRLEPRGGDWKIVALNVHRQDRVAPGAGSDPRAVGATPES
jgi:hypothetical protein